MRSLRAVCFLVVLMAILFGARPSGVAATTGPDTLPPADYSVPTPFASKFLGQYVLQSVASGARLRSAQMAIDFNALHYLAGIASFFGYDSTGQQTTWVGSLYQFHQIAKDAMVIEILAPVTARLFGKMYLHPVKGGDLVGQIALPTKRYAIRWHKNL